MKEQLLLVVKLGSLLSQDFHNRAHSIHQGAVKTQLQARDVWIPKWPMTASTRR